MRNKKIKEQAIAVFKKALPDQANDIKSIKDIHTGYTNYSFLVELNDGTKYQVRIPHSSDLINRKIEHKVLQLTNNDLFVYFDEKTGIAIKKWVEGKHPNIFEINSKEFLDNLFSIIKKLHSVNVDTTQVPIEKICIEKFNEHLHDLAFEYQKKYLCLIDRRRNDKVVLSHSDINPLNLIYGHNDKITLIDFEWCCLASDYWDYANWVRETGINFKNIEWNKYIDNFSMETFQDYLFLSSVFAYAWTFAMPESRKIISYRKRVMKQVAKYYKLVLKHEKTYYN